MPNLKAALRALAGEAGIACAALTTGSRMIPFADNGALLRELNSRIAAHREPAAARRDHGVATVKHAGLWPPPRSRTERSPALAHRLRRARDDSES